MINLDPQFRDKILHYQRGSFYICVRAKVVSTYSIKVREFTDELHGVEIEDSVSESFYLKGNSNITNFYKLPKLEYFNEDF